MVYSGLFEIWSLELPYVSTDIFILLDPLDGHYPICGTYRYIFPFL